MSASTADPFAQIELAVAHQVHEEQSHRSLAAARAKLVLGRDAKSAFFACLVLRLKSRVDWSIDTMATDGRVLAYNPTFVTGLSPDELVGVLSHEVMHNALAHATRQGTRDPRRWNIACDLAVNPLLTQAGFTLPKCRLMPGEGRYAHLVPGKSADEYYAALQESDATSEDQETLGGSSSGDPGACGGVLPTEGHDAAETSEVEAEWAIAVVQAEQAAKGLGELPGGLARQVDRIVRPVADWRAVLHAFVSSHARNDYSWSRPNRRFLSQGLYLPGMRSEELGDVVLAVDTSGSVGAKQLALFASEIDGILSAFDCSATVLYHDTAVQNVQTWQSSDGPLTLDPVGGGGTSHECVFDWLQRSDLRPACVICLTDLDTNFPTRHPDVPVLWAVVGDNRSQPPFGVRVNLDS